MSPRKLALFTTAAALALAGGVTAASASLAALPPPPPDGMGTPSTKPSPDGPPSPSPSASGTAAPDKEKEEDPALAECRDAECDVEIKNGQEITLGDEFGVEPIKVKVTGTRVTFTIRTRSSQAITTVDAGRPGASTSFNGVTLQPHKTKDGKLMLKVSHD
ncbi:hypothetical protein ACN3XK_55680 [Actinomadura welshii]